MAFSAEMAPKNEELEKAGAAYAAAVGALEPMLKEAGIPILALEREEHLANAGQLAIRAEAFIEMIEKED